MSILKRRKTERADATPAERPAAKLPGFLKHPSDDGTLAVFLCMLSALIVPYLLQTVFFTVSGIGLSTAQQGAIALVTLALASGFLGMALLRVLKLPPSFESTLYAAIRLFCFAMPALFLELLVFNFCFRGGSYLPRNVLFLILALLAVYAASHTILWATAILYERDAILPSASLFGTTWKLHLKNPLSTAGRFLSLFLAFWAGAVLFPLLSAKTLVFLYRTIWGSILLAVVYAFVLTVFVHLALRMAAEIVVRAFPAEETEVAPNETAPDDLRAFDIELAARDNARNNPSSAEELLIEKGLLTNETAYGKPAARITDADIPVQKPLFPEKWTFRDFIPLVIAILLLVFVGATALIERTTVAGVVSDITTETRAAAAAERKAGNTSGASEAYRNGLGDLEAFDAYLNAIAGGAGNERLDEASAQLETYSELFNLAESYSNTSSLPYLLEAKLLLKDDHPDLAAKVLQYMIDYEYDTDETYLLLLTSLRAAGRTDSDAYRNARKVCVSRRSFIDSLAYLDSLTVRDAQLISQSMQDAKTEFYRDGQLLLWQSYRENGEIETAYNGLYALLADERFTEDLDVLRAFIETGSVFHLRFDGTADGLDAFYATTAASALEYDRLYTVARAAGETTAYSLLEIKHFVSSSLIACKQYASACSYLAEALGRYPEDDDLINYYRIAYSGLTEEERETIPAYEALQFHR